MSTQQTLTTAAATDTADDGLSAILEKDDAIAELSDLQVMDAWVRGQFMHQILRGKGPRFMHTEEFERIEKLLQDAKPSALKQIAIQVSGRHSDLSQCLGWEDGPGNVITLFDRWTKDDAQNPVEAARGHLKSGLRGCGMPRIEIYRHRVNVHTEHPDELTMGPEYDPAEYTEGAQ